MEIYFYTPLIHSESEKVKVTYSCQALCNPMDYIVHGILQARIPEWVAVPFSRGSSQPRDRTQLSHQGSPPAPPRKRYNSLLLSS